MHALPGPVVQEMTIQDTQATGKQTTARRLLYQCMVQLSLSASMMCVAGKDEGAC